ncbi:hypothetical protein GCM10011363_40590 [Marivita lacus]|uniref:Uncharacterized protein n=1 Tax=Marivita lacus TaxID=1323742 RepID=A0ABQ1L5Q0_9RHOB|nr:hypothetical protein GCM10011363_40590 [Marivita lacus]
MLAVKPLIDRLGWETRLQDIVPKLRCSACKSKGYIELQIVYVSGSGEALLGAGDKKPENETGWKSG